MATAKTGTSKKSKRVVKAEGIAHVNATFKIGRASCRERV